MLKISHASFIASEAEYSEYYLYFELKGEQYRSLILSENNLYYIVSTCKKTGSKWTEKSIGVENENKIEDSLKTMIDEENYCIYLSYSEVAHLTENSQVLQYAKNHEYKSIEEAKERFSHVKQLIGSILKPFDFPVSV